MRPAAIRSLVASAVLALSAAALTAAPTATAAPTTSPASGSATTSARVGEPPLRIGTYNIRAGVSLGDFKAAVTAFKPQADVAGLQEIGSNERNKYLVADRNWGYYRPPKLQQNPVIWRRDLFDFVGARGFMIAKARDLNGEHSGDEAKGDSFATVVRLVQRTSGEQISFINVHLVRGAVKGGRPAPGRPNLFKLYADQVSGTVAAIKAERAISDRVYVLGDFNVGYEADAKWRHRLLPYKKFGRIGLSSMWKGSPLLKKTYGTHNDALIDQVWNTQGSTSEAILTGLKQSDHSPAVATYTLPLPAAGYAPTGGTVGFADVTGSSDEKFVNGHLPVLSFDLTGDLAHGYAGVDVVGGNAVEGKDFAVDDSGLYDTDVTHNAVLVKIYNDNVVEGDETFTLRLIDPVNTTITRADEAVGTIVANKS